MSLYVKTVKMYLHHMEIKVVSFVVMLAIFPIALEVDIMSVIKDIENRLGTTSREFTKDSMNQDFSYEMAERLTALLLEKGFITDTERQK